MATRRYVCTGIEPDPCGDFVHNEDHAAVEAERDALAVQVEQLTRELLSVATAANECGWNGVDPKILAEFVRRIAEERDAALAQVDAQLKDGGSGG